MKGFCRIQKVLQVFSSVWGLRILCFAAQGLGTSFLGWVEGLGFGFGVLVSRYRGVQSSISRRLQWV